MSVGMAPVMSRYVKAKRTFVLGQKPELADHDPRSFVRLFIKTREV